MRNNVTLDAACRLIYEVKTLTGSTNWTRTVDTLKAHFNSPHWDYHKARELIRRHVREAKRSMLSSADTPAIELATDALLVELACTFKRDKVECRHVRKQRQQDEYFCPDCKTRWEVDGDGDEEYYDHFGGE
jgi:hypothetical protein